MTTATIDEAVAFVEPCTYPLEAEWDEGRFWINRCGRPSVDDDDEPRCAEHLDVDLNREGDPAFNGAFDRW